MIDVTVENFLAVQKQLTGQPKKVNQILARAINRTATNVKANMAKKVREEYVIKASDVKDTVKITRATSAKPRAEVRSAGKKISLAKFRTSPREPRPQNPPAAYKVQVLKSGGLKPVERGFLANVRGNVGFFQRTGASRLPMVRLMGPSVPQMIGRESVIEWVENEAKKMLNNRIQHEFERELGAKA